MKENELENVVNYTPLMLFHYICYFLVSRTAILFLDRQSSTQSTSINLSIIRDRGVDINRFWLITWTTSTCASFIPSIIKSINQFRSKFSQNDIVCLSISINSPINFSVGINQFQRRDQSKWYLTMSRSINLVPARMSWLNVVLNIATLSLTTHIKWSVTFIERATKMRDIDRERHTQG